MRAFRSRRQNAFTLIELIVVVIILGLLLAVALPSFFGASNSAKDSAAQQYLTIAYKELRAQHAANDGVWPSAASLAAQAMLDEPELSFVAASAANAANAPDARTIYVETTATGIKLGIHSLTTSLATLQVDATTGYQLKSTVVPGGPFIPATVAISAGSSFACAVATSGTVKCWGYNGQGQLGDGTLTDRHTPVPVSGISNATAISAGVSFACAVLADGSVSCWGSGAYGTLGNSGTTNSPTPVLVTGITTAIAVSVGNQFACALLANHTISCWGRNNVGQLGNNSTTNSSVPVPVSGITTATAISAGGGAGPDAHACALLADGSDKCWGYNGFGPLGDGTTTQRLTPVLVSGLSAGTVSAITASGGGHSCAVLVNGTAQCWGSGSTGQLGNGTQAQSLLPVVVSGSSNGSAISAGFSHTCAIFSGGLYCWGRNVYGELGDGTNSLRTTPVPVTGLPSGVAAISAGIDTFTCALLSAGGVKCWGTNANGELGNGNTTASFTPVSVSGL